MVPTPHPFAATGPGLRRSLRLTRLYERLLLVSFSLSPSVAILYLQAFQGSAPRFEHHVIHELAIALAIALSVFVSYVTLRCYESSGEAFLRWLTLGLLGFSVVYAPHGILTRLASHHMEVFLLYGPASRFVMAACLLRALLLYGEPPEAPQARPGREYWLGWIAAFLATDVMVASIAMRTPDFPLPPRLVFEAAAVILTIAGIVVLLRRGPRSPLMQVTAIALAMFAQSSIAFVLSKVWNHSWWLAHAIFASGFLLLSFGVVRAFHTTRAFSTVFSQEEMMRQLYAEKERAESALNLLRQANTDLRRLAATDPLTGASNRRHFMSALTNEWARCERSRTTLALLALDIDHFKRINDTYGHHAGDLALKAFVNTASAVLRPGDVIGRIGGEEFAILLPQTGLDGALGVAERIRGGIERLRIEIDGGALNFTVSIGVSISGGANTDTTLLLRNADHQLYRAKHGGRNRVEGGAAA